MNAPNLSFYEIYEILQEKRLIYFNSKSLFDTFISIIPFVNWIKDLFLVNHKKFENRNLEWTTILNATNEFIFCFIMISYQNSKYLIVIHEIYKFFLVKYRYLDNNIVLIIQIVHPLEFILNKWMKDNICLIFVNNIFLSSLSLHASFSTNNACWSYFENWTTNNIYFFFNDYDGDIFD